MTGTAERLLLLQYGAERVSKGLSLAGGDPEHHYWEPLFGVLVQSAGDWILFDTGMSRANHDSTAVEAVYRGGPDRTQTGPPGDEQEWHLRPSPPRDRCTWGLPGDPLVAALAGVDLTPGDLSAAVVSHLHWDHAGGITTLTEAGVPVVIHTDELAYGRAGAAFEEGFDSRDWTQPTTWRTVDADTELAAGVSLLATPGHTPGHLSFEVTLPQTGAWIFTADATDLAQNLLDDVRCGYCAGGTAADERRADASLTRLLGRAAEADARLVPGHDQVVLNAIRHPPGGHR